MTSRSTRHALVPWTHSGACTLVFLFSMAAGGSLASAANAGCQDAHPQAAPPRRPRVSDERLLAGRSVTVSLEALLPILERGYEVVVHDEAGRKMRGLVSSFSSDRVVIHSERSLRLFSSPRECEYPADSVTRIDIVDSAWNGALIGAAIAPVLVFAIHRWEETTLPDSNSMKGLWTIAFGGMSATAAIAVGYLIDREINQPIHLRGRPTTTLTVAPRLEPSRVGVVVRVRF